MASDSEDKLEEMLKQAARLEARLAASREGSVYTMDDEDSVTNSRKKAPPVDEMLRQAELLSQKMRASRQHAFASVLNTSDDSDDTSMDDMLRRAEMLSKQMKSPDASPSPGRRKRAVESTPALIRQSERLLSKAAQKTNNGSGAEMNTPELMRQTDQLLGKLKASRSSRGSIDDSHTENGSNTSGVLSNPDALLAKMKSDQRGQLLAQQNKRGEQDSTKSEELRRLMEQALSSWAGSVEQKGRVKEALEQIVPNLGSTPHTPSTVSIQPPDHDEISSVGSLSPRTRKSASRAISLLGPAPTSDLDAAEELVRNMAIALKEARSEVMAEDSNAPISPLRRPEEEAESGSCLGQPRPPPRILSLAKNSSPSHSASTASERTRQSQSKRNVPPPPLPPPETPPIVPNSSISCMPNRGQMSSEEAQYNAILSAIDSSSPPGRPVNWERVESAGADDEDYVPLVDYSKKSGRSLGVGTFAIPVIGRSPRVRKRGRRFGRVLVAFLALAAIGLAVRYWLTGDLHDLHWNPEPSIESEKAVRFEEPVVEPPEEPVYEQYDYSYRAPPVADDSKAIILHRSAGSKLREKVAFVARQSRKAFLLLVISLTPPWERFCSADPETCRDTDYLLNSIVST